MNSFRRREDARATLARHAIEQRDGTVEPCLAYEKRPVPINEPPVQPVHDLAPIRLARTRPAVVAHLPQIVAAAQVRLGRKEPAVSEQRHPIDIRAHHPLARIHEHLHEPSMRVDGFDLAERHEIAGHHESFDVVSPAPALGFPDHAVERQQPGGSVVPMISETPSMPEEVGLLLPLGMFPVHAANELAPADDLAHETLDALERQASSRRRL